MEQEKPVGYQYQICVEGHIGMDWVDWPRKVDLQQTYDRCGQRAITLLSVSLPDQPALYGLLDQLRDLNLKLIYTQREEG